MTVHDLALRIISRNRLRVPKVYRPRPQPGAVESWDYDEIVERLPATGDVFVLARNRLHLRKVAIALQERGEPYLVEGRGAYSPLGDARLRTAVQAGERLADPVLSLIAAVDVASYLQYVASAGVLQRGTKKLVQEAADAGRSLTSAELSEEFGLARVLAEVRSQGSIRAMTKVPRGVREHLLDLVRRYGYLPEPRIRLTSIHGSKGREADHVVLLPCMTRSTWDEYRHGRPPSREAENRVFYVGATRAKETLALVRPWARKAFDFPRIRPAVEIA